MPFNFQRDEHPPPLTEVLASLALPTSFSATHPSPVPRSHLWCCSSHRLFLPRCLFSLCGASALLHPLYSTLKPEKTGLERSRSARLQFLDILHMVLIKYHTSLPATSCILRLTLCVLSSQVASSPSAQCLVPSEYG